MVSTLKSRSFVKAQIWNSGKIVGDLPLRLNYTLDQDGASQLDKIELMKLMKPPQGERKGVGFSHKLILIFLIALELALQKP